MSVAHAETMRPLPPTRIRNGSPVRAGTLNTWSSLYAAGRHLAVLSALGPAETIDSLGAALGVSRQHAARLLRGERAWTDDQLAHLPEPARTFVREQLAQFDSWGRSGCVDLLRAWVMERLEGAEGKQAA
jgi:hypothetical protein